MKKFVIFLIISLLLLIYTFPKVSNEKLNYYVAPQVNLFEITIKGCVVYPGTYQFIKPVTLGEVISQAGGFLACANIKDYTLTRNLDSTRNIYIDKLDKNDLRININTATIDTLTTISYITESRALEIIKYRTITGGYNDYEELLKVNGIGEKTLEKIKPYIRIN